MRVQHMIFLVFSIVIFSNCGFRLKKSPAIPGSWRLYSVKPANDSPDDFEATATLQQLVKLGSMISFFKDSSFFQISGDGRSASGRWRPAGEAFKMDEGTESHTLTRIREGAGTAGFDALQLQDGDLLYFYRKLQEPLQQEPNDPFYGPNNSWRIAPAAMEDSMQLRSRMAGYFKHLALLLKAAKERQATEVSFEFSKGPVKIYNGGIGIYPFDQVPAEWKRSFFNEGDARKGYDQFEKHLRTDDYRGASVGNWIDDDVQILQSIYADFYTVR